MRIKIEDLPEQYQIQVRDKIAVSSSYVEQNIINEIKRKNEIEKFNSPVVIHIHSKRNRLADSDGISAKWVIDSLVESGLLSNDSPKEVREVTYSQEKTDGQEETIIRIQVVNE